MVTTPPPLQGQVAIVTGSGRGIGRAVAQGLAAAGAAVVVTARTPSEVEATADVITAAGGRAVGVVADVGRVDDLARLVAATVDAFGGLDLVVANAGVLAPRAPVVALDEADWQASIAVNVDSVRHLVRLALPHLRARGGGRVLVMGSGVARRPGPGLGAYAVSKAAASMLVRVLALELRADRIAVNEIVPGPVRTAMAEQLGAGADPGAAGDLAASFPKGEWLKTPDDVVPLVLFCAQLPCDGPTGQTFSLLGRDP